MIPASPTCVLQMPVQSSIMLVTVEGGLEEGLLRSVGGLDSACCLGSEATHPKVSLHPSKGVTGTLMCTLAH